MASAFSGLAWRDFAAGLALGLAAAAALPAALSALGGARRSALVRLDASARYSEAVVARGSGGGGTIHLAGQVATDDALADCATQTRSVLAQVDALLARAGSDKSRLLSATVYLTSLEHFAAMNEVYAKWLPAGCAPARATVGNVTLANPKWLVEIVVVAAL